ncbi:T9SS sorting signal type C domain-containing protein [Flavobacterium ranwuense]|uniref:T9SS sorting signal type C domain-containing protein n=1 Tax=Flavobacterium ranwuense TaxID=2541725 RepID=A0ABY2DXQ6_9FLAO|nr:T9SS sorting signal type C domain-containing protein [Flavobacterium ranwuense]TDE31366.1 T9SS sorting signal type C domain-containing protein [Flavobacterium ranwuense]
MIKELLCTLFLIFFQTVVFAATNTYSGSTTVGGKLLWSTAANWSLGAVPTAADDVVIPSGKTVILDIMSVSANSINVSGTLDLNKSADITINTQLIVVTSPDGHINFDHSIIRLPSNVALYLQNGSGSLNGSCNNNDEVFVGTVQYAVCVGGGALYLFSEIEAAGGINVVTAGVIGVAQSICSGATPTTLTSTTAGTGSGTITYEWQTNTTGSFVTIPSATSSTYSPPALTASTSYKRRTKSVFAGYTFYSAYTTPVIVTVNTLPNNTASSGFTGGSFCIGSQATLTFDADDTNGAPSYTLSYTDGITTYSQSVFTNASTIFNVSATTSKTYTLLSITNANGCVNLSPANKTASVTFRPNPTATVSGITAVCLGATSPNITFTNPQAAGITATYTINGGINQTVSIVASGTANVAVATTVAGSFVYALVSVVYSTSPSCTQTLAGSATVTINALPSAPTVAITQPTCTVATGSVILSGLPTSGAWILYQNGVSIYSATGGSGSYTVSGLSAAGSPYTFTVSNGTCTSFPTANVVITAAENNTWKVISGVAKWDKGTPNANQSIIFETNYSEGVDVLGCSCEVKSGIVTIPTGETMTITNGVTVSGGSLTFENNASLVQINEDPTINSGDITYKRTTKPIRKFDYTYWSSPVVGYTLGGVSPNTLGDKFYSFDADAEDWAQESSGTVMKKGMGYIIRGPQNYDAVTSAVFPASFVGKPNNGAVSIAGIVADRLYLIGNPYPSALDADEFLKGNNAVLDGTLYFWTHNSAIALSENVNNPGSGAYAYSSDDYASYNRVGGVGTVTSKGNTVGSDEQTSNKPSGKIASGQGFFVSSNVAPISGNTVVFNNTMRVGVGAITGNNLQFFRIKNTSKSKDVSTIEKNRIWLNLTNNQGAFKQTLVGYVTGATNEYEGLFDGESYDGNLFVDFYSINEDKNLTIQGRALPFDKNDEVTLGYSSDIQGAFSISIDEVDGILASEEAYIEDKDAKIIHNLKEGAYNFTTEKGAFNNRFVLRYTKKALGTGDFVTLENSVLVSNKNKQIKIDSPIETIDKVILYDLSGRKVFQKNNINDVEFSVFNLVSKQQFLVVKVTLQNGHTVTKKIMY